MTDFKTYEAPVRLEDALELLTANRGRVRPVAGGTDVLVRLKRGTLPENETVLLSLKNIPELHTIGTAGSNTDGGGLRIGAAVTMRVLETSETIRERAPILSYVANKIASPQIRAAATIGGNVANASPAADTAIPLLLLEADVETARLDGGTVATKRTPMEEFFKGPGETLLDDAALITAFYIPPRTSHMRFVFEKGGVRPAMECAVVSAGCGVALDAGGVVQKARVAFGAVAPTPVRAHVIEEYLEGKSLTDDNIADAVRMVDAAIQPISDVRGSAAYRRELTKALLKSALYELRGASPAPAAGAAGGAA
jgi:CO/xanthine dehydrogenase FAD-binding subunit